MQLATNPRHSQHTDLVGKMLECDRTWVALSNVATINEAHLWMASGSVH